MLESTIAILGTAAGVYLIVGAVVAIPLHLAGLRRIDPAVTDSGIGFRMLVTPGMVALWPLLLVRWRTAAAGRRVPGEADAPVASAGLRRRHRLLATALLVVVPTVAVLAVASRPAAPVADRTARAAARTGAAAKRPRVAGAAVRRPADRGHRAIG